MMALADRLSSTPLPSISGQKQKQTPHSRARPPSSAQPAATTTTTATIKTGFHIPPFSSVPHLHLHVLVPPYTFLGRFKYPIASPRSAIREVESQGVRREGNGVERGEWERGERCGKGERQKVKGWSWFVTIQQTVRILDNGGRVRIGGG